MPEFSTVKQYHQNLQDGKVSCVQTVRNYLDRISAHRSLNAFIEVYGEEALETAASIDARFQEGRPAGRLAGLVIGIKDVLCHKNHRVSAASRMLEGYVAPYSATAVQRLLDEGAIIIGRTNCDEFAMGSTSETSAFGKVLNPLDPSRVPGGSSGGSAVAVSAGLCMASLGSDTGGSVRQPADFCGIIGFKPGYGRVSRFGLIAYASSFDQIGIFGRNIDNVAEVLSVIAGPDDFDSTAIPTRVPDYQAYTQGDRRYTLAYLKNALDHPGLDPEIRAGFESLFENLRKAGHRVEAVDFELMEHIAPAYYVLTTAEASSNLARYDGIRYGYHTNGSQLVDFYRDNRSFGFGREVKRRIMLGTFVLSSGYYEAYYTKAQQVRRLVKERTDEIFSKFDYILLPNSPVTAFPAGQMLNNPVAMYLADIYTVFANLAGVPAVSLPLFRHSNGMPFGAQVMGNLSDEAGLIQVSSYLMNRFRVKE
ncbi:MAG TPA: Asp-tRNA(Asn)/Glu-tRNA(Gln) amidotransferase subunit GatA [Chitinophagaceae bacterium]|nr:Asp-tRNA(Asn)/Glu-tRNA(Gln) amidotransferase subunit GatA [Chitinophagaceae bacterium]